MMHFLARRAVRMFVVVFGVTTLVFGALRLSGDPTGVMLGPDASAAEREALAEELGLNDPLWMQYGRFVQGAAQGDFGRSFRYPGQSAFQVVWERMPATIELTLATVLLSWVVSVPLGAVAALNRGNIYDRGAMFLALVGQSTPVFWLGIMLIVFVSVQLGWLPTSGRGTIAHLVLPTITLAVYFMASIARLVRSSMLDVLGSDFIRTARAKGLPEYRVHFKHALRNAALPVITIMGLQLGTLLGGAVVTETIFAWPGAGRLAVQSVLGRDYPVVQTIVFLSGLAFALINLIIDVIYAWIDPRIRYS